MDEVSKRGMELGETHWGYIEELLKVHGETEENIKKIKFHYVQAMKHGYKHGFYAPRKDSIVEHALTIDEPVVSEKTSELKELVKIRRGPHSGDVDKGEVVARMGSGTLIHRKPLDDILKLKEEDKMTPLNMATVLHRYHPVVKSSTIAVYRSGYQNFINKSKDVETRMNTPLKEHETVTEKDKNQIVSVLMTYSTSGVCIDSDTILRELDMTEYKLGLALKKLNEDGVVEISNDNEKIRYRLIEKKNEANLKEE